ncbi:MAG: RluA family pseudouridine synthase [Ruminococcaceae bacterium]|nr:RluA family pseudouridine synthase [Oscillospiraceae bacterium]
MDEYSRLDVYVAKQSGMTRSAAQNIIAEGYVLVNGKCENKNYKVKESDAVDILDREAKTLEVVPQDIPLDIVFEDEHLIVVNKPKDMVVHPAPGNYDGTLVNALLFRCRDSLSGINGIIRPGIVHRIDKNTSGLLVVAKNDVSHIGLADQIKVHSFERKYQAVIIGHLKEAEGTVNAPIGRHPKDRKKMAIVSDGRKAVTHYRVIEEYDGFSHIELRLETGRTHQIRVHMQSLGHPVLGDDVYGELKNKFQVKHSELLCGQCLHAKTLGFVHPISGEYMRFDSELPPYFKKVLELIKG